MAVLSLDQIHRLLRYVGQKQLGLGTVFDWTGQPAADLSDTAVGRFWRLAVSEIRLFGAGSMQVPRRLRAMLEHLIAALPDTRGHALRQELSRLYRAVERDYLDVEDRQRAAASDRQGIGGSSGPAQGRKLRASGSAGKVRASLVRPDTRIPDGPYTCCFVVCRHLVSWYAASLGSGRRRCHHE